MDLGTTLQLAGDIADDSKNPAQVAYDALTLFKSFEAVSAEKNIAEMFDALDTGKLLVPAAQALVDMGPILLTIVKDDVQKSKLRTVLHSLPK